MGLNSALSSQVTSVPYSQLAHMLRSGRRVHALAPDDAFGIVCHAVSLFATQPKETERAFTTLAPSSGAGRLYAEAALAFGASLIREKKFDAAMKYLDIIQRSEAFRDMRYRIHNLRGSVFLRRNDLSSARAEFLQSIAAREDYPIAHYNLGIVLEKTGYIADAVAAYRRALSLNPRYRNAALRLKSLSGGWDDTADSSPR